MIGFHITRHASNFLDTVAETFEARVDFERLAVDRGGRRTWVRPIPIAVDGEEIAAMAESSETKRRDEQIRADLGLEGCKIGLGVDRLDYTKGLNERFEALNRFLEKHHEWRGKFAYIQIGVPSRIELNEYRKVQIRTRQWAETINNRYPRPGGPTVHLIEANLDCRELVPYYRMADMCTVTSLHDGMNLVAKEYLAASIDLDGALVLSPFTGAARELERAWIASPFDREGLADAYHAALSETPESRRERMTALRETVLRWNIFDWTLGVLDTVVGLDLRSAPEQGPAPPPNTGDGSGK
jgi:trehalose 6-phosphate synthase